MGRLSPMLVPMETGGEEGFESPGVEDFNFPPIFDSPALSWLDKPMLQAVLSIILVMAFWVAMARKNKMVPGRGQFIGEAAYFFIRDSIGRDIIGHDFKRYLPYLIALFSFVLVNNLFGLFPLLMFPTASHVGWAYGLAIVTWVIYNGAGIAKHGFGGYFKRTVLPEGVPWPLWILVIPIEFLSNILVRPLTLSLRLFANLFAGHLVVLVFVLGGEYLLLHGDSLFNNAAGGVSLLFSLLIMSLELLVLSLQAYIFTVLTAQYISSSIAEEH